MKVNLAPGLHVALRQAVNVSAYDRWVGRWSPVFLPAVSFAAEVLGNNQGDRDDLAFLR